MPQTGFESALYVNTGIPATPVWTEIDLARDVTLNRAKDELDATARATARTGYKATENGLKEFSVEFESLVPKVSEGANAAFVTLETAWKDNTTVEILHTDGGVLSTDGLQAIKAVCNVFGGTRNEPNADVTSVDFSCKLASETDAYLEGVTASGAFVPDGTSTP